MQQSENYTVKTTDRQLPQYLTLTQSSY